MIDQSNSSGIDGGDGGLIVDFPGSCSTPSGCDRGPMPAAATVSVSFAETSNVVLIEYPSQEELRRRWYSMQERAFLKREVLRDACKMSRKLTTTPMEDISLEDLFQCIGLEGLLTPELMLAVRKGKRYHSRSILLAQHLQCQRNITDAEELSLISQQNSESTRTRSQEIAARYWTTLKF
mmetsp:Transcript_31115/g.53176  ORF Transcript_31115/g.53176 Transcript_31115/m.53176 type:complete len:180 (+) Transcript_31115:131-670(+)|eukprot:CAMPEP_0183768282 /NCGR_PEP_ID=MMETSP0739-20130205/14795_1 /TAXON_ID=385413 /ORGANISM="Thalassiosira miniscula, Strain CCMP1093" /LENGTH=179 /DNA_ID=CAMNT_0026007393 /DNA_START=127 /DNA_END=666 /DNA_ORIENTATION=+